MEPPPPWLRVYGQFRTSGPVPDLTATGEGVRVDPEYGRHDPTGRLKAEVCVGFDRVDPEAFFAALAGHGVRVGWHDFSVVFAPDFWDAPPDDCAGAALDPDGFASALDPADNWRVVPLTEPFAIDGRPAIGGEHERGEPHLLWCGGIPIVGERLLATLRSLGARGETADVIYMGQNKAARGKPQPGYRRFLAEPVYEVPGDFWLPTLPDAVPDGFGVCSVLRSSHVRTWHEITLDRRTSSALRARRRSVLQSPVFSPGGPTHRWASALDALASAVLA